LHVGDERQDGGPMRIAILAVALPELCVG